jgi:hypothetical protein
MGFLKIIPLVKQLAEGISKIIKHIKRKSDERKIDKAFNEENREKAAADLNDIFRD